MIRHLQTLAAVARHGTFAAAGDRLGLTQSAVSVQMRKLEEALGVELFDRAGRTAVLNEQGRRALVHAESIVALFGQMAGGVADADVTGTLRAGAITTELLGNVVDAMAVFRERFPNVEVHLTPGTSVELVALVEKQRLDCALIVKPAYPLEGALRWQPLRQEPFVLIVPEAERSDDVAWLLANLPFIRYDRLSHGGSLVERFLRRQRYAVRESMETDSIEAIGLLVARGAGVAILPKTATLRVIGARVREVSLGADTFYREVGMVERSDNPRAHLNGDFWRAVSASREDDADGFRPA
ncbi:LysR family transcriptional regulator [Xylophilus sp. GOD-11R]|uniref:LysR family transcriptional regulator n=1 Tax=Xylophilus sp. GOD-11R TaxID=3089814 RepID=UPI00298CF3DC|nr:LysR family transcriptional regulator [Xylophilus sp. GOD-11R]WPB55751.1 LysR family transcriptional regulator [Xylophilus sp. GOD-11R]